MRPGRAPDGLAQVSFVRRYVLSDHSGYVKLRRDLFRHVKQHLLNSTEAWVYVCMIGEADYRTGVWWGSAGLLASLYRMPERTCRRCLSSLESKGYIKRFHTPHSMLSYAVLINKYEVAGNVAGMYKRLNTELSNTYNDLVYDDVREDGQPVAGEVAGTIKNKEVRSEKKEKPLVPVTARNLAELLKSEIQKRDPEIIIKESTIESWAHEADKMMRLDGISEENARTVLEWSQHDPFWQNNILSIGKFRKQYPQLKLKMNGGNGNGSKARANEIIRETLEQVERELASESANPGAIRMVGGSGGGIRQADYARPLRPPSGRSGD